MMRMNAEVPLFGSSKDIVIVEDLVKTYPVDHGKSSLLAVGGVSFSIAEGQALAIVGESGSGKTTTARCVSRLIEPSSGKVVLDGIEVTGLSSRALQPVRRRIQHVFQDPRDSLNPRWTAARIIDEPLRLLGGSTRSERDATVDEMLEMVSLESSFRNRRPHELSGGQQQRIGIARALATRPRVLILDEPTSALDSFTRVSILNLLNKLKRDLGLTYLFISHDVSAVRRVADRVAVMYLGKIVEEGPTAEVLSRPKHPYTKALLSAVLEPRLDGRAERLVLRGEPGSAANLPPGCAFNPRCLSATNMCAQVEQHLLNVTPSHAVACMHAAEISSRRAIRDR